MRRIVTFLLNLTLIPISVVASFYLLKGVDAAMGVFMPERQWHPQTQGFLFPPGTVDHWKTHDYACTESINSLGFRDHEVSLEKGAAYRIVAIGDSFTYGWGVNIEDTWEKRLEFYLRARGLNVEVLNLGKPAAGPNEYAQIADAVIPALKPDLLILGILSGDDIHQVTGFDPAQSFPNLFVTASYLKSLWNPVGRPASAERSVEECRRTFEDAAKSIYAEMGQSDRERFEALEEPVKKAFHDGNLNPWLLSHATGNPDYFMDTLSLDALRTETKKMGWKFQQIARAAARHGVRVEAFSLPEGFYVNKEAYRNVQRIGFHVAPAMLTTDIPEQIVGRACQMAKIPFHSVLKEFRQHQDESGLYFELDRHMTPAGNDLFAKSITPVVAECVSGLPRSR